jgi:hypothetical protein
MKLFTSSENKDYIRTLDLAFVEEEYRHHGQKLRYFGLPSEALNDVRLWEDFIGEITAVEYSNKIDGEGKQSLLVSRALQLGYSNKLTLLRGDINNIIIANVDEVGSTIPYPFDLINLDYGGSVLYPDRKRIEALNVLLERQRHNDFLMLITSNVREFDKAELLSTQERIKKEVQSYRHDLDRPLNVFFDRINDTESPHRQVLHLQFLAKFLAETKAFNVICFPAVLYEGSRNTEMIHYVFRLRYEEGSSTRVVSDQSLLDVITQKLQVAKNGKLRALKPAIRFDRG